jgi:hypothetical protein
MRSLTLSLVALLALLACNNSNAPAPPVDASQLHFVVQDTTAPPLYSDTASFLFTVGQNGEIRMYYADTTKQPPAPGEEFLRFDVPGDGFFRKPDGTLFQPGDTVRISITVVDPTKFLFEFQPSGLQFSPEHPAALKVQYAHSNHDYNDDGVVDPADSTIQGQLDIWKNDPPSTLWFKLGSVNIEPFEELDANVFSFSQFAIAW